MDEPFAARFRHALAHPAPGTTGVAIIRLGAIQRNYGKLRDAARAAETACVVKANAYGLGVREILPTLETAGCRTVFVATLAEAERARAICKQARIYVLDGLLPDSAAQHAANEAWPVLSSFEEIEDWASECRFRGTRYPAAIHIDTGMTRLGMPAEDVRRLAATPGLLAAFDLKLIMSHLACADDPGHAMNEAQRARFEELAGLFPGIPRSLANSAGIMLGPQFHFDLTRPGIALYGGRPSAAGANPMEPVLWLFGRIAEVRWAEAGETVGYGAMQTLKRRSKIATVTAGYADGFFRALSASDTRDGPPGYIGGHRLPLLGRVSMDLITYDATDVPDELIRRGGFVEILGERVTVDDLATFAGTIGYEVLTSLGRRFQRIYEDD
jgi:alanine racemase